MMSWAGGWFFLMAAEQFTLGDKDFRLPGLGSYLKTAADVGNVGALLLGLATLVAIIVLLDQLVWRPLVAWSEKFRFEQTESGDAATSAVLTALRRSRLLEWLEEDASPALADAFERISQRLRSSRGGASTSAMRRTSTGSGRIVVLIVLTVAGFWGLVSVLQLLAGLS